MTPNSPETRDQTINSLGDTIVEKMSKPNKLRATVEVFAGLFIGTLSSVTEYKSLEVIGTLAGALLFFAGVLDPLISDSIASKYRQ